MAHHGKATAAAATALKPLDLPSVDRSITRSSYMGNLGKVKDLLEAPVGKPADITEKDTCVVVALL